MRISDWSSDVCSSDLPAADLHFRGACRKALDEGVVDALLNIEAGRRDAHLSSVAESLPHDLVERGFEVAIVEHQHRGMAAKLHRDPLHAVGGQLHQMFADRGRAGEADLADHKPERPMPADHVGVAIDELDDVAGDTRIDNRSEEHTSELQSLMRISDAVF